MCLSAYQQFLTGILTIVALGQPEGDLFARYPLKDQLPMGLLLIVIFHPFDWVHKIVLSVLVGHHPVVPWVVAV